MLEALARGRFRPGAGTSFRAYLCTTARNRFIDDHVRRAEATRTCPVAAPETLACPESGADATLEGAAAAQDRARLLRALAVLPLEQREVLALWAAGLSVDEVARLMGTSRNTVLSRKRYALSKLRRSLAPTKEATNVG